VGTLPRTEADAAVVELSIVIPAYNESARIERTLDRLVAFLHERKRPWEIVVADDGSRDRTAEIVEAFAAAREERRIRLVRLTVNQGKGAALRAGVLASRGDRVLIMDADLATPLEELAALERALEQGHQIATGSRRCVPSSGAPAICGSGCSRFPAFTTPSAASSSSREMSHASCLRFLAKIALASTSRSSASRRGG
jgi:glycosyltransferase involved in cell wall biosynthesis